MVRLRRLLKKACVYKVLHDAKPYKHTQPLPYKKLPMIVTFLMVVRHKHRWYLKWHIVAPSITTSTL